MSVATGVKTPKQSGYDVVQTPTMSPEIMQMVRQLRGQVEPGATRGISDLTQLAQGGTPEYWKQIEAPAQRQFAQAQGNIASRFSAQGLGSRKSSAFQNAQGGLASELSERLQANRLQMQQSAQDRLMDLYMSLMNRDPYEMSLMEKKRKGPSWGKGFSAAGSGAGTGALLGSVIPGIGTGVGAAVGGGLGFLTGLFGD